MNITESYKFSFFPFGHKFTLKIEQQVDNQTQAQLVLKYCINQLLPQEALVGSELNNLRCRNQNSLLASPANFRSQPSPNELFYLNGILNNSEDQDPTDHAKDPEFEYAISTSYKKSSRDQGYSFACQENRLNFPDNAHGQSTRAFLLSNDFEIKSIRLGIFKYSFPQILPLAPIVYSTFLLDLTNTKLYLQFTTIVDQKNNLNNKKQLVNYEICQELISAMITVI